MHRVVGFIIFILVIIIYLCHPSVYNYDYSKYCAILYWVVVIIYLIQKKKINYFDFDCLFFLTYFFVTLFYPVFMYESDPTRYFMFKYDFNVNVIPQASGLALLGLAGYVFGALQVMPTPKKQFALIKKMNTRKYFWFALLSFLCFIVFGGYTALRATYSGDDIHYSSIASYLFIFCPAFLMSGLSIEIFNFQNSTLKFFLKKISKVNILITFFIILMILATGSRTLPLQVILLIGGLIAMFYRYISLPKFLIISTIGMIILTVLGAVRGIGESGETSFSLVDVVMDLIINNRNTYVAIEYANNNGLTYGESMLSSISAPIPFLQSVFINVFGFKLENMASSTVITKQTLGEIESFGLGTNIIADLYMSFGAWGIIIFMPFLGYFVNLCMINAKSNIYALVSYGIMLSYSVFLVRAEFFTFLRFLLWSLLIVFMARNVRLYQKI